MFTHYQWLVVRVSVDLNVGWNVISVAILDGKNLDHLREKNKQQWHWLKNLRAEMFYQLVFEQLSFIFYAKHRMEKISKIYKSAKLLYV